MVEIKYPKTKCQMMKSSRNDKEKKKKVQKPFKLY